MEKRQYKRFSANLRVRFFNGHTVCSGTIRNISEGGMFIQAGMTYPFELRFTVFIFLKGTLLKVPVRIIRMKKGERFYESIAVAVIGRTGDYEEFVSALHNERRSSGTVTEGFNQNGPDEGGDDDKKYSFFMFN